MVFTRRVVDIIIIVLMCMMETSRTYFIIAVVVALFGSLEALAMVVDNTTFCFAGDDVRLSCSFNTLDQPTHQVSWQHIPHGNKRRIILSTFDTITNEWKGKHRVDYDPTTGRYDLILESVQEFQSGYYFCNKTVSETSLELIVQSSMRNLTIAPVNTIAMLGGMARLNCSTSYPRAVYWQHVPAAATAETATSATTALKQFDIFVGDLTDVYESGGRHEVLIDETTGQYDLVIRDLKLSDAGSYFCLDDVGFGVQVQAELVVLVAEPVCQLNASASGIVVENDCGVEPDYMRLSCSVEHFGNIPPSLIWKRRGMMVVQEPITTVEIQDESYLSTADIVVRSDMELNDFPYSCELESNMHAMVENPRCTHTRHRLHFVFDAISIGEQKLLVASTSKVTTNYLTCSAHSSDPDMCKYIWIEHDNPDLELMKGHNVPLPNPKFVAGLYQCIAVCQMGQNQCNFRSAPYEITAEQNLDIINLVVIIILVPVLSSIIGFLSGVVWHKKRTSGFEEGSPESERMLKTYPKNTEAISIKASNSKNLGDDEIRGLAVLHPNLYVLCRTEHQLHHIKRYNCPSLELNTKSICSIEFGNARDMICCDKEKMLFIIDDKMVYKIKLPLTDEVKALKSWQTGYEPESLSMTYDRKILVTFLNSSRVILYDTDGVPVREIPLQSLKRPLHVVFPQKDLLFVSIEGTEKCNCSSCVYSIDLKGNAKRAIFVGIYDKQCNNGPCRMAASARYVLVADNKKIMILDLNMENKLNEIDFEFPSRFGCLDEERSCFYVASDARNGNTITIFKMKRRSWWTWLKIWE